MQMLEMMYIKMYDMYKIIIVILCSFFFFKQKTAYEMRISDLSSDVCSSDLLPLYHPPFVRAKHAPVDRHLQRVKLSPIQPKRAVMVAVARDRQDGGDASACGIKLERQRNVGNKTVRRATIMPVASAGGGDRKGVERGKRVEGGGEIGSGRVRK